MQPLFIAPVDIQSPRWSQAFPHADIVNAENELPLNLSGLLIWVVLGDVFTFAHISKWVASGARVVALTQNENPQEAKRALEVGANGYVHYLAVVPVLQQASQVVEVGGLWLGIDLMRQLMFATASILAPISTRDSTPESISAAAFETTRGKNYLGLLSAREQAVAKAVAAGKSNKEVAKELDITERTVKAHLSAVFEKLHVRDRLHLVLMFSARP